MPFDFVDTVVYINLKHRTDRNKEVYAELIKYIPLQKIVRFDAIKHKIGLLGCVQSHIAVLEMAILNGWNNCLIVEDDAMWKDFEKGYELIENLVKTDYDVVTLGNTYTRHKNFRLIYGQTTTAYLIKNHYYATLLNNFKESMNKFQATQSTVEFALDKHWHKLINVDKWYCVHPPLIVQRPSFSDILMHHADYTKHFTPLPILKPE